METMLLDGKMAHHGGDICVMCGLLAKSLPSVFFVPTGMHLGVNSLTAIRVPAGMKNSRAVGFIC